MGGREQEAVRSTHHVLRILHHVPLVILALVLLWPVVVRPSWWIWAPGATHSDLAVTHWPNAHFARWALWDAGRFPLWRPTIMGGTPFAANPLAGLYYPPNWPLLFLPWLGLAVGFNLSALAHVWLAGAGMYALMRRGLGTGVWGALVAAVAYQASPKLLAHLGAGHVGWVQAWGWMPVVVLCWLNLRSAALTGAALAVQFCADARMAAYTLVACGVLGVARCWMPGAGCSMGGAGPVVRTWRRAVGGLLLAVCPLAVFLGLAACQWLPLAALLPETTRGSMTLADAVAWSLPWRYLAGLLLADHGGFHEWMTYTGVSTLVLAGVGAWALWRRGERRWLMGGLIGLLVGAAWFSLGENGGLFQALWHVVPGLGLLRVPPRAWVLVVFAVAVLAGFGMEGTGGKRQEASSRRRVGRWLRLAVGTFPPMLALGYRVAVGAPPLNLVMFGLVTPLAVALVGFSSRVGTGLKPGTLKPETLISLAAVLLVAVDLLIVDRTLVGARPPEDVFAAGREAAEWLAAQPGRFRVYSPSYSVPQHVAERYGLALADGVDPLQLRAYADYLTRAAGLEPQGYSVTLPPFPEGADVSTALREVAPDARMLGRLGVRYVAAAFPIAGCGSYAADCGLELVGRFGGVYVYRNEEVRPVADAGEAAIVLSDGTALFRYRPWPVYAGWVISGVTGAGLLVWWWWGRGQDA